MLTALMDDTELREFQDTVTFSGMMFIPSFRKTEHYSLCMILGSVTKSDNEQTDMQMWL